MIAHEIINITSISLSGPYSLRIVFNDGVIKTINFQPILKGKMYGPLANPNYFSKVSLDNDVHTIVWPNGADFDPALLYHWEENIEELTERAQKWDN